MFLVYSDAPGVAIEFWPGVALTPVSPQRSHVPRVCPLDILNPLSIPFRLFPYEHSTFPGHALHPRHARYLCTPKPYLKVS